MLTCSAGYATLFSRLCYPVQQAMLPCSAGYASNTNTVVALAQAENQGFAGLASWGWGQANWKLEFWLKEGILRRLKNHSAPSSANEHIRIFSL